MQVELKRLLCAGARVPPASALSPFHAWHAAACWCCNAGGAQAPAGVRPAPRRVEGRRGARLQERPLLCESGNEQAPVLKGCRSLWAVEGQGRTADAVGAVHEESRGGKQGALKSSAPLPCLLCFPRRACRTSRSSSRPRCTEATSRRCAERGRPSTGRDSSRKTAVGRTRTTKQRARSARPNSHCAWRCAAAAAAAAATARCRARRQNQAAWFCRRVQHTACASIRTYVRVCAGGLQRHRGQGLCARLADGPAHPQPRRGHQRERGRGLQQWRCRRAYRERKDEAAITIRGMPCARACTGVQQRVRDDPRHPPGHHAGPLGRRQAALQVCAFVRDVWFWSGSGAGTQGCTCSLRVRLRGPTAATTTRSAWRTPRTAASRTLWCVLAGWAEVGGLGLPMIVQTAKRFRAPEAAGRRGTLRHTSSCVHLSHCALRGVHTAQRGTLLAVV